MQRYGHIVPKNGTNKKKHKKKTRFRSGLILFFVRETCYSVDILSTASSTRRRTAGL